jgi:IclR family transcriptional regulator, acetate operon repressor
MVVRPRRIGKIYATMWNGVRGCYGRLPMNAAGGSPGAPGPDNVASIRSMNSVLSTLRIFEEVAMRQPIGVSDLSRVTGIPKSSVQRCLVTLKQAGWLRIVDTVQTRWGVTARALSLGLRGAGEQDLRQLADPVIKRLAAETGETVHLALRDGNESVIIGRADTTKDVRVILELGTRLPLQATSAGVAMLARLAPADIAEVLKHEVDQVEGATVPSTDQLRREIELTAVRGYAVNVSSWYRPHVCSIGVAVTDSMDKPIAGIAISIPEMRYDSTNEATLAELANAAAAEINGLIRSA